MDQPSLLTPEQRSSEWFEQRLGKVTASRVADTMEFYKPTKAMALEGIPPKEKEVRKRYREALVAERLTGISADPEPYVTYDMKWGIANESIAKNVYQLQHRRIIEDAPFVQHKELLCGASPDGFVTDPKTGEVGTVEIKCLRSANHLYKTILAQEVPPEHLPQIQMQMWITGTAWCEFIAYDSRVPEGLKIFVQRVPRDDDYINKVLEPAVRKFLEECDNDFKHFWASVKNKDGMELKDGIVRKA